MAGRNPDAVDRTAAALPAVRQPKRRCPAELERAPLMWWLTYRKFTKTQVVILQASSLIHARTIVSKSELDEGMTFQEGHELDAGRAKRVPEEYISKMLGRREAEALLRKMEGQKKPRQRGGDRGKVCVD
jgi:hypothetical protein